MFLLMVSWRNPGPLALLSRAKIQVQTFYIRHLVSETQHKHCSNYHLQCPQSTQVSRIILIMNWTPQKCGPIIYSSITVCQKADLPLSCKLQIFARSSKASGMFSIRQQSSRSSVLEASFPS